MASPTFSIPAHHQHRTEHYQWNPDTFNNNPRTSVSSPTPLHPRFAVECDSNSSLSTDDDDDESMLGPSVFSRHNYKSTSTCSKPSSSSSKQNKVKDKIPSTTAAAAAAASSPYSVWCGATGGSSMEGDVNSSETTSFQWPRPNAVFQSLSTWILNDGACRIPTTSKSVEVVKETPSLLDSSWDDDDDDCHTEMEPGTSRKIQRHCRGSF